MSEQEKNINEEKNPSASNMTRRNKRRIISIASICLVLAAVILVNVIASVLTDRYAVFTTDITSDNSFGLSEESVKIAQGVKKDVTITFLTDKVNYEAYDTYCKQATNIADQLKKYSDGKISVEYKDLLKNPNIENEYKSETLSVTDVLVTCGEKYNLLKVEDMFNFELYGDYQYISSSKAESAFDTAIVKVTSDTETKIGIITDNTEDSYSTLESTLAANNYALVPFSIENEQIPDDVATVICYAPTKDYSKDATDKLRKFLKNDDKYDRGLIFIAYRFEIECPNITDLLYDYGMKLEDGLAFETQTTSMMTTGDAYRNIAANFSSTKPYMSNYTDKDFPVLVSMSRAVTLVNESTTEPLLMFSSESGICPYSATDDWVWQDYITGNVIVMAQGAAGGDNGISRLIFSGSTEMWNSLLTQAEFTNKKYILNILNDINHREDTGVYLSEKVITKYDLSSVDSQTKVVTSVIIYAVLPVLILGVGVCVFIVRRRK